MDRERHYRLEKNYLIASASAVFTAFLCINIYPEYHGGPQIGRSGLLAISAAMIAMIVFIVRKAITDRPANASASTANATPDGDNEPASDPARLKRMFFLWSISTVLLSASLIRYPLYLHFKMNEDIGYRGAFSLLTGTALIVASLVHVAMRRKDYRKL